MPGLLDDAMDSIRNIRGKLAPLADTKTPTDKTANAKGMLDRNTKQTDLDKANKLKSKMPTVKAGKR